MTFEKYGQQYEVTEQAHIDAFRAKGWVEVEQKEAKTTTKK